MPVFPAAGRVKASRGQTSVAH